MKVEIWSDVVCPWCYIGKRRFEKALAGFPHRDEVEIVFRSFELDPHAERVFPGSLHEMLAAKVGGDLAQARQMNSHVSRLAAQEGLEFRLDEARPGNTFDAHRLVHLAGARGLRGEAVERIMRAYFGEGVSIGEPAALVALGRELGFRDEELTALFDGDAFAADVREEEAMAQALGATGVPFFVFDRRYGVSGAQAPEHFRQVLERTRQDSAMPTGG